MRFLDVFSGIGGFRAGLEKAGHTCVGHIERDVYARKSYSAIYDIKENEYDRKDITEIEDFTELRGKVDLLCGGFPCQSFSIAGRRKGFDDVRGTMFFYLAKIIEQAKPPFLLFENVKGLLSHDKGETFKTIITCLDDLGYDVEWQLLNSKNFGVPQNRERVYIIGYLRGSGGRKILPIRETSEQVNDDGYTTTVPTRYRGCGGETYIKSETKIQVIGRDPERITGYRVYNEKGLAPTLVTAQGGGCIPYILDKGVKIKNGTKQGYQEARVGDSINIQFINSDNRRGRVGVKISNTLTTGGNMGTLEWAGEKYRIRKLTPKECWRLQGFSDEAFEKARATGMSDSQLYKQAGNAVTVNVVYAIGKLLKEVENEYNNNI